MKAIALPVFVVMCLAQWFVPAKMIYESETIISGGTGYKFKTQPIDPSDPFRGKYITLNFDANSIILPDSSYWDDGEEIFVTFTTDSAGFAKAAAVYRSEPSEDVYLKTTVTHFNTYDRREVFFDLPFDRLYLEESKASQAEQLYWQSQRDSTQVAYGLVTIGKGRAVLIDVMINDKSVVDIINELNQNQD